MRPVWGSPPRPLISHPRSDTEGRAERGTEGQTLIDEDGLMDRRRVDGLVDG